MLQVAEHTLQEPLAGEVRIRVLATPVCQDDIAVRVGNRPFLPKTPFVPGYSILGVVDAIGPEVTEVAVESVSRRSPAPEATPRSSRWGRIAWCTCPKASTRRQPLS